MTTQLAPGFLVASPSLADPYFKNSVIFLLEHDEEEGSFGIIINREAEIELMEVFRELNISVSEGLGENRLTPVMEGGPVTPEFGWVIHSPEWKCEQTKLFKDSIGLTASRGILEAVASGGGPLKYWFCLGYSGWGKRQLTDEVKEGAWIHLPFELDLLFEIPFEERWLKAISRLGIDPAFFSPTVGGA